MVVLIKAVKGYAQRDAHNLDASRATTRSGTKKATFSMLSREQVRRLKAQSDTPQGRRDRVLLHLLLDHGLRCSEVARLQSEAIDPERATMTFYCPKVYKTQTHILTPGTEAALTAYLGRDVPLTGPLLWASRKSGQLTMRGMSERAITSRVAELGRPSAWNSSRPMTCATPGPPGRPRRHTHRPAPGRRRLELARDSPALS